MDLTVKAALYVVLDLGLCGKSLALTYHKGQGQGHHKGGRAPQIAGAI